MKKIILATLISGAMSASALAADAGKGQVTFNGSIIEAPCSIAPGEENQTVELGQVSNVTLENGGESSAQPFSIQLEGCNTQADNQVSITFGGSSATNTIGLLDISGTAAGAGVQLLNASGAAIKVGEASTQSYVKGDNELKFQATLKGLPDATVVPGNFSAVTQFTLAYN